jgi:2-polyprenyl-6-hydroxyphenyl methylase/3-demethylubiquinone-9 3-methyltransferase
MIDNDYYHHLGERWLTADNDPIALLRAETKVKNPWVLERIANDLQAQGKSHEQAHLLDVGCGAGFLTHFMAQAGLQVTGLDASESSLKVARSSDSTQSIDYILGDARKLPFETGSFDYVCAMDFLEHVEDPQNVIAEIARVLKPGGLFFFHTFNQNKIAHLLVIKFVEWLVPNTPKDLHVIELFIKPSRLASMCQSTGLEPKEWTGIKPNLFRWSTLRGVIQRRVPKDFSFSLTPSLMVSYLGFAQKTET